MTETVPKTYTDYILPPTVVSRADVSRMVSELERIDNEMTAAAIRRASAASSDRKPMLTRQLTDFVNQNELILKDGRERERYIKQLRILKEKAPEIHMTFSVEADPESLQKLAQYVRESIHPQAVISVGLQPSLIAGVYLRTPNHVRDLSLRALIKGAHDGLVTELETLRG